MILLLLIAAEILFISIIIILLYRLQDRFGLAPLYIFIGSNQYLQAVLASTIYMPLFGRFNVSPGSIVLFTSSLFAILLIYIMEDVPKTRTLIYGIVLSNLTLAALSLFTKAQIASVTIINVLNVPVVVFEINVRLFIVGTIVLIFDSLLIVIVYEYLFFKLHRLPLLGRIVVALLIVLYFDSFFFTLGSFQGSAFPMALLIGNLVGKTFSGVLYGLILYVYLIYVKKRQSLQAQNSDAQHSKEIQDVFTILTFREKYEIVKSEKAALQAEILRRIQAETALRESEERYRNLVEMSPDAIIIHREGRIEFANTSFARLVGAESCGQLIGRAVADFAPAADGHDGDDRQTGDPIAAAYSERKIIRCDGTELDAEMAAAHLNYLNSPAVQYVFRDATGRKEAERMKDEYTKLIVAQKNELAEINMKLQELDRIKANFTAMIVHDLKSPLTVIKATLDFLEEDKDAFTPEELSEIIKASDRSAEKMLNMINELLEVFRSDFQEIKLNCIPLAPEPLLYECVEEARLAAASKQITVNAEIESYLPDVSADRSKLGRVFSNLLSNAVKFTPKGGSITVAARIIKGTGVESGLTLLLVSITDTGEGIPSEDLPFIFDPYQQARSNKSQLGVGLGLAIVKRIAAAHGGNIEARSQVGIGASFRVTLPILQSEAISSEATAILD